MCVEDLSVDLSVLQSPITVTSVRLFALFGVLTLLLNFVNYTKGYDLSRVSVAGSFSCPYRLLQLALSQRIYRCSSEGSLRSQAIGNEGEEVVYNGD